MADDRDSRWVDFKSVRASVSFPALLEKLEVLDKLKGKGDRRQGPCPLHRPESSTSTSFSVDLKRGMFNCFACRQHGNVLDFTAAYLKVDLRTAALQLCDWFGLATGKEVRRDQPPLPPAQPTQPEKPAGEPAAASPAETAEGREHDHEAGNPVLTFRHGKGLLLDPEHETVKAWGLKPETVAFFGMGYSERSKVVGKRVAVPIHNEDGDLIGYAGRATMNAQIVEKGKWTLPAGFHKKLVVFNLCRAKDHCCDRPVIVVEGFRACITLHERGYPNTVALMGNTISPQQVELLAKHISSRRAIVLLDGNNAGREATPAVVTALAAKLWVRAILLEDDRQPD
ncbi:MAG TPA: CHC2 zinc finger domain-containing protein, partial [Terriglobia bacterium]|nr:CHC2 zinc finger domain-containing protein [Terriglobia bacterium]